MIAELEKHSERHAFNVSKLNAKIRTHEESSSKRKKVMRWVSERKLLDDTQDGCEASLELLITPNIANELRELCKGQHRADHTDCRTSFGVSSSEHVNTDDTSHNISHHHCRSGEEDGEDDDAKKMDLLEMTVQDRLQRIRADVQMLHIDRLGSDKRAELRRNIASLHKFIEDQLKRLSAAERTLTARVNAIEKIDIKALFQNTQLQFDHIESSLGAKKAITGAFAASLAQEQDRVRNCVDMCSATEQTSCTTSAHTRDASSTDEDAVEIACSVLDMCSGRALEKGDVGDLSNTAAFASVCERVHDLLPRLSRAQVRAAVTEAQRRRLQRSRCKAAIRDYQRAVADILLCYETAVRTMQEQERAKEMRDMKRQQAEERQHELHTVLERQREVYHARKNAENEIIMRQQAVAQAVAASAQTRRASELQKRLRALAAYEHDRALAQEKERQLQHLRAQEEEAEKVVRMEINSKRVTYRQQQREERQRLRQRHEQEVAELTRRKEKSLQCFFRLVEKNMSVQTDPQRVRKHTVASAINDQYVTAAERALTNCTGFTDEQVMRDPRVRLYHALLEAGLHTTSYGREMCTRGYHMPPAQRASENNPLKTMQP